MKKLWIIALLAAFYTVQPSTAFIASDHERIRKEQESVLERVENFIRNEYPDIRGCVAKSAPIVFNPQSRQNEYTFFITAIMSSYEKEGYQPFAVTFVYSENSAERPKKVESIEGGPIRIRYIFPSLLRNFSLILRKSLVGQL